MEHNVPYVRQPVGSIWCGAACATMLLKFYGINTSLRKVAEELNIVGKGLTGSRLASYFLSKGFETTIQTGANGMARSIVSKKVIKGRDALRALRHGEKASLKNVSRKICAELRPVVNRGGSIILSPVTSEGICVHVEHEGPVILLIDRKNFEDLSRKSGHFVVAMGVASRDIGLSQLYLYAHDPALGPKRFVSARDIVNSCNGFSGTAIYVKPKTAK